MSNYATAIGLDVHARSIKACALNPMTGEVERASFGYDPVSVAEWVLGFEEPRAVYESGVTGFHVNVNPSFTDSTNAIAPFAPTHPRRFRRRQAPFPASRSGARSFVR